MAVYRLPCACGESMPVAVGRAGGEVECPACGARVQVPTLRRLRELPEWAGSVPPEPAAGGSRTEKRPAGGNAGGSPVRGHADAFDLPATRGAAAPRGHWGLSESILVAAAVIAASSLLLASWLARPLHTAIDASAIRRAVAEAPTIDLYRAWRSFEQAGVARAETPEEERVRRITRARTRLAVAVGLLGGTAALTAMGAAAAILARRRLRPPAPGPSATRVASDAASSRGSQP